MRRFQRGKQHLLQRSDGVAAVEFALVLPVLLVLVCGIMDFGNLYAQMNIVNEAAREGARIAAVGGTLQGVQAAVTSFGSNLTVSMNPSTPVSGTTVTVTVTSSVQILTPIINAFFPSNPYNVTGKTVMQVE